MKTLWLMIGIPGSGKSTWIQKHKWKNDIVVSRDEIRFDLLGDNEDYFAHESEVFSKFSEKINEAIKTSNNRAHIYVDATHLTKGSRAKLLKSLDLPKDIVLGAVNFRIPLDTCLERNSKGEGRERVPDEVINKMYRKVTFIEKDDPIFNMCVDVY